jgi:hypothetical protein
LSLRVAGHIGVKGFWVFVIKSVSNCAIKVSGIKARFGGGGGEQSLEVVRDSGCGDKQGLEVAARSGGGSKVWRWQQGLEAAVKV